MSDLPHLVSPDLEAAFVAALDPTAKLVGALDALGPIADRDVVVVGASGGPFVAGMASRGSRLTFAPATLPLRIEVPDESADVVLGLWSAFRGVSHAEVGEVDRVLRPGGRHLVVHDYGRDDVSRLHGNRPEYGAWSQRSGPFLTGGFRVRVVHCFWEFASQDDTSAFLGDAFGEAGATVARELKRPRLSWNVAVYHRTRP